MGTLGREQLESTVAALGALLAARGARFEIVVIGGGNLILRGLVSRPTTRDIDILGEWTPSGVEALRSMPDALAMAIADVARAHGLAHDWMNLGPANLLEHDVPDGFHGRLERHDFGGLVVWLADRVDMVAFKLFAAVDQGPRSRHLQDLRELRPTRVELLVSARWTRTHDPSPGYRVLLLATLDALDAGITDADLG